MLKKYEDAFNRERHSSYPIIDAYERQMNYAIERTKLEEMARTLACPVKVNPPNWQHGRVIYATLCRYLGSVRPDHSCQLLDIGTAKGFSACVMAHAIADSGSMCSVVSVDIVDPQQRVARNSIGELDGLKTVPEFVAPFISDVNVDVSFLGRGSRPWLQWALSQNLHVPFAFVDGKHTYEAVAYEAHALAQLQRQGDIVIFDDCQIDPVWRAVSQLREYDLRYLTAGQRKYAIAVRR